MSETPVKMDTLPAEPTTTVETSAKTSKRKGAWHWPSIHRPSRKILEVFKEIKKPDLPQENITIEPTGKMDEELYPQIAAETALKHNRRGFARFRNLYAELDTATKITIAGAPVLAITGFTVGVELKSNLSASRPTEHVDTFFSGLITHVVDRQTAYPPETETQITITREQIENKYGIHLATEQSALATLGVSEQADRNAPQEWTQEQLRLLDQHLANLPPELYGEINGHSLTISLGESSDIKNTDCVGSCSAVYIKRFNDDAGLIILDPNRYTVKNNEDAFRMITHELVHREDFRTDHKTSPAIKNILGDMSYLKMRQFTNTSEFILDDNTKAAMDALRSFAGGDSNPASIHQIFVEGVAITGELYASLDYRTFVTTYGQFLDWGTNPDGSTIDSYAYFQSNSSMPDSMLQEIFPKADALYRLFQDKFFSGNGYDKNGKMIKGSDAIPTQARIPIPTRVPVDNNDNTGMRNSKKNFAPGTVVTDNNQPIGRIESGKITSIIRPPIGKI
ncbi:MAG TPA: hypothetical protein VMR59_01790 [Patescibacteria group bacterium]|jgi:hypothetical protein|nr:hypothetical protein [Patescibacteria group bacterium]